MIVSSPQYSNIVSLSSQLTPTCQDFDLSWVGSSIKEIRGCNNKLGAVRLLDVHTLQGVYEWHEELVKKQSRGDGSVLFEYQLKNGTHLFYHVDHDKSQ